MKMIIIIPLVMENGSESYGKMIVEKERRKILFIGHQKSCSDCFIGKQHRVYFRTYSPRRRHVLDLIICLYYGYQIIVVALILSLFIDYHSTKVCAFVLKSKN